MTFVKLTDSSDGSDLWVNLAFIDSMVREGDATWLSTSLRKDDQIVYFTVRETPEEILAKIKEGEGK